MAFSRMGMIGVAGILAALALDGPAMAQPPPAARHVKASLVAEPESIQPGQRFWLGIRLQMEKGWHTYWSNPADSGLPTKISWRLPEGFAAGPIQWPYPARIAVPPLMSYGYEGDVLLPIEISAPASLAPGSKVRLGGRVDWLECRETCIPGKAKVAVTLPVRAEAARPAPTTAPLFAEAWRRLPGPASGWGIEAEAAPGVIGLAFRSPRGEAPRDAYFFAAQPRVIEYAAPQPLRRVAGGHRLELTPAASASQPSTRLKGVLVAENRSGPVAVEVDVPIAPVAALPPALAGDGGLAAALGFAFLGGLALNLMPCVLPVLSLKVLSFVRHAGEQPRRAWRQGAAFTIGVLVSFWGLAGLLLLLRAGGEQVGWGFQLQSLPFVAFLAGLFFLLGLNLFGVFEVGASLIAAGNLAARQTGLASSFWNGALATLVATPCTAPFMGSALGFGLSQPPAVSLLVFTALGLGMAAPYLVLSLNPRLLRFVPRPGAWMAGFKQLMGFFLMTTVVALVWLFGQQAGVDGMALLLAALLAMGLGGWIFGRGTAPGRTPRARLIASTLALLLVAGGFLLGLSQAQASPEAKAPQPRPEDGGLAWEEFTPERLAELRAQGRPVFIDFTAAWCLTCQVNERVALRAPEVETRFRREGVVLLRADWTRRDERITQALASYGRQGVPLYVLYGPGASGEPRVLPEVITPGLVLEAIEESLSKEEKST